MNETPLDTGTVDETGKVEPHESSASVKEDEVPTKKKKSARKGGRKNPK